MYFDLQEQKVIQELGQLQGLTYEQVVRQALRLYQMHILRIRDGETVTWSGDARRAREFVGVGERQEQEGTTP